MSGETPERIEALKDIACFPVTREAANNVLSIIRVSPLKTQIEGANLLKARNPQLNSGLILARKAFGSAIEKGGVTDGAVFAYLILNEQAMLRGKKVPKVSEDAMNAHIQEGLSPDRSLSDMNAPRARGTFESTWLEMEEISKQDVEFEQAIKALAEYRTDRNTFYYGAVFTYSSIRKMEEAQELEKKFNL
jgi:hypothetical protein